MSFSVSVWIKNIIAGKQNLTSILVCFPLFLAKKINKKLYTVLAQTISAALIKRCLYKHIVHISVNTDVKVSVFKGEM